MPKKKQPDENKPRVSNPNVMGLRAAMLEQPIKIGRASCRERVSF